MRVWGWFDSRVIWLGFRLGWGLLWLGRWISWWGIRWSARIGGCSCWCIVIISVYVRFIVVNYCY